MKIRLMRLIREYLFKWYEKQFEKMVEEVSLTQKEHIINVLAEAEEREIPIVIELNPLTALGMATIKAGTEEDNVKKENPFTLVKDEDD